MKVYRVRIRRKVIDTLTQSTTENVNRTNSGGNILRSHPATCSALESLIVR